MQKKHFFTLIEILVATGIIAILAGIGFAGYSYANNAGREKATKMTIHQLTSALEACHTKLGFYPAYSTPPDYNDPKYRLIAVEVDVDKGTPKGIMFYLQKNEDNISPFDSEDKISLQEDKSSKTNGAAKAFAIIKQSMSMENILENKENYIFNVSKNKCYVILRDAWGNPIYFRNPGCFNKTKYDIISAGPDGTFGSDSAATPVGDKAKYIDDDKDWICDDIANF